VAVSLGTTVKFHTVFVNPSVDKDCFITYMGLEQRVSYDLSYGQDGRYEFE